MVYVELGKFLLYIKRKLRILRYWIKIRRSINSILQSCNDYMVENNDSWAVTIKVSSNPKNRGINKWKFFISASNIHPQISLILLNVVSFYSLCNNFGNKCLKMKLLKDICTGFFCRIKKNAQVSIYSIADLNTGHCGELTFWR